MCWHSKVSTRPLLTWTKRATFHFSNLHSHESPPQVTKQQSPLSELRQEYRDWMISTTAGSLCFAFFFFSAKEPPKWKPQLQQSRGFDRLKYSCLHLGHMPRPLLLVAGAKIHQNSKSQIRQTPTTFTIEIATTTRTTVILNENRKFTNQIKHRQRSRPK